jgi:predicted transcriptional regulator
MSTLTLRVPEDLDRALERQSAALGISKSDLAREALRRYLRVTEFRTLRTKLVARTQASGINTDEDVFEALRKN